MFRQICFLVLFALLCASGSAIDSWALAGHGVARSLWNGSDSSYTTSLKSNMASTCVPPSYFTSGQQDLYAGAVMNDNTGIIYVLLICQQNTSTNVWAIDSDNGTQLGFASIPNVVSVTSYIRFFPDGTLAIGVNNAYVVILDPNSLELVTTTSAFDAFGSGGVEVFYYYKPVDGVQQMITAGCDDGCWGAVCNIINGHDAQDCQQTGTKYTGVNTVLPGADGVTTYNNHKTHEPEAILRFSLNFPSTETVFNLVQVEWPWWVASDLSGDVFGYNGVSLTKFDSGTNQVWNIPAPDLWGAVQIFDDESTVVMSNMTTIILFDLSTGKTLSVIDLQNSFNECVFMVSPWQNALPAPLQDSDHMVISCQNGQGWVSTVVDKRGNMGTSVNLNVLPYQTIVDNSGNFYAIGQMNNKPTIQKVAYQQMM